MTAGNLDTTNLLLGIMAAVSVLEALLLIAVGIMAYRLYSRTMQTVREVEQRQIAPLVARVNTLMEKVDGILVDVKEVTARVTKQTERVDSAIHGTMGRVDETAARVKSSVASQVGRVFAFIHGARCAVDRFFNSRRASGEAPAA
jgi:methyl-accepting chemotaxis protein